MADKDSIDTQRWALGVEYNGAQYNGWQRQSHSKAVQSVLESILSQVADHPVEVTCAGRTDSGVHATNQVVHFDCHNDRPEKAWLKGVNGLLPDDISVHKAVAVDDSFHARFSATSRSYQYIIDNCPTKPAILSEGLTWIREPLDEKLMQAACPAFYGELDFSSFRSSQCQSHSVHRNLTQLRCRRVQDYIIINITANAFLHHMVRNIVGVLIEIGAGRKPPEWSEQVLEARDRTRAAVTAPANGLYLTHVAYPETFGLNIKERAPLMFSSDE